MPEYSLFWSYSGIKKSAGHSTYYILYLKFRPAQSCAFLRSCKYPIKMIVLSRLEKSFLYYFIRVAIYLFKTYQPN